MVHNGAAFYYEDTHNKDPQFTETAIFLVRLDAPSLCGAPITGFWVGP